ncbi:MAG: alpha/beta fold hydrolase [Bacteroidota bacterium]
MAKLKTIAVNDTVLHYSDVGPLSNISAPVFLFVHGAAASCNHVSYLCDYLIRDFRVISYSQRFHLPNHPNPEGMYGADIHAHDLVALMEALELKDVVLLGHSYGGLVAASAAVLAPHLIKHLFLAEATLPSLVNDNPVYKEIINIRINAFENMKVAFEAGDPALAVKLLLDYAIGGKGFNTLPEEIKKDMIANASSLYHFVYQQAPSTIASKEALEKLSMPITLLLGEKCTPMYKVVSEELQKILPTAKQKIIHGVAHDLIFEAAEDCAAEIKNAI